MNNLEKFKVKVLNKSKPHSFKINLSAKPTFNFKVGDTVTYRNDSSLHGIIENIFDNELSVKWDDNTREHISISNSSKLAYVDDIETVVVPLNNQSNITEPLVQNEVKEVAKPVKSKPEPKSELDIMFEQAFNDMDDEYNDIESANPNIAKDKEIEQNLKEQQMKRRIKTMENKIENKKIDSIKDTTINEIISLMKNKNMLSDNDVNKEREKLLKMNDEEIERFKTKVCNAKVIEKTEAELALERIKASGPVIGDFSKFTNTSSNQISNLNEADSRDLKSLASKNSLNNSLQSSQDSIDIDSVLNDISNNLPDNTSNNNLNLSGFQNIKGLTKPIQVIAEQKTPRQTIIDDINKIDWTIITKSL